MRGEAAPRVASLPRPSGPRALRWVVMGDDDFWKANNQRG